MGSKYSAQTKFAIDKFWRENKFPPTIADIMSMVGIPSSSHCRYILKNLEGVRLARNGRVIPLWVDNLFQPNNSVQPTPESGRVLPAESSNSEDSAPAESR